MSAARFLGRLCLSSFFVYSGYRHAVKPDTPMAFVHSLTKTLSLPSVFTEKFVLMIVVLEILGGLLLLVPAVKRFAAMALSWLLVAMNVFLYDFWSAANAELFQRKADAFFLRLAIIGALVQVAFEPMTKSLTSPTPAQRPKGKRE